MLIEATDADLASIIHGRSIASGVVAEGGLAAPETLLMLRELATVIRASFAPSAWLIVEEGEVRGLCSITKPPLPGGVIEIGYGVAASRWGRGTASRAIGQLLEWARSDSRVNAVIAETSVDNPLSQRVLERNGFARVGQRIDAEDGEVVCWRAEVATAD
jgi:RimJ/RimL family protein N-acetyltransferase